MKHFILEIPADIQTAKNAGIDVVVVSWGYGDEKDLEDDYVLECIDDFDDLVKYF